MGLIDKIFGSPSRDKFARVVAGVIRSGHDVRSVTYDRDGFALRVAREGAEDSTLFLHNFHREYCELPRAQRKEFLERVVCAALTAGPDDAFEDFATARARLRAKIWSRFGMEYMALRAELEGGKSPRLPLEPIGAHLLAGPVYDLPAAVRTVSEDDIERWGTTHYEAMEAARYNLEAEPVAFAGIEGSFYVSAVGDSYDSSRLLLVDAIRKLEVRGDHVAMVPHREGLIITGSEDEEGLKRMIDFALEGLEQARPMSAIPLRLEGDEWVDWMPPADHALFPRFRTLEVKTLAPMYSEQQQALNALNQKRGVDEFVATYSVVQQKDTGELKSYCVWGKGIVSLLPVTPTVIFVRSKEGEGGESAEMVASAPWSRVREVVGGLMQELDCYPPRYRVRDFPSDEQLQALGNEGL